MPRLSRLTGALIACLALGPLAAQAAATCEVVETAGNQAQIATSEGWQGIETGTIVPRNALLRTGPDSAMRIACDDGLRLTLGAATEIGLKSIETERPGFFADLFGGILGLSRDADDDAGEVILRTPLAIASVRSTEWLMSYSEAAGAAVFVREGTVEVRHGTDTRDLLTAGDGIDIAPGGAASPVRQWADARITQSMAALRLAW